MRVYNGIYNLAVYPKLILEKKMVKIFIVSVSFSLFTFSSIGFAADCNREDVFQVQVPIDYGKKSFKKTNYRYQKFGKGHKTIVLIPGGPGQAAIGTNTFQNYVLPDVYQVIVIDARGSGCNDDQDFSSSVLKSTFHANDIIEVIRGESLSEYIILSFSYGTVPATIVGNKLENQSQIIPPKSVILQSPHAFPMRDIDLSQRILDANIRLRKILKDYKLSDLEHWYFSNTREKNTITSFLGEHSNALKSSINSSLIYNNTNETKHFLLKVSEAFAKKQLDPSLMEQIQKYNGAFVMARNFSIISCAELICENSTEAKTICNDVYLPKDYYFSKNWLIRKTNLIYFSGTHDLRLPPIHAKVHYESQQTSRKSLLILEEAGHSILSKNLKSCLPIIYKQAFLGQRVLESDIASCNREFLNDQKDKLRKLQPRFLVF